jgi:hypothetical protein
LVYLDANVPADGENSYDAELIAEDARAADRAAADASGMPGFITVDAYAEWIRDLMPDPGDQAWLFAKLVPQPLATYTQPIRLGNPAAAAIARAFVFCTEGKGTRRGTRLSAPRTESGRLRAGATGSWRTPTLRRSTPRRRQLRRSCPRRRPRPSPRTQEFQAHSIGDLLIAKA